MRVYDVQDEYEGCKVVVGFQYGFILPGILVSGCGEEVDGEVTIYVSGF